ncbi:MAG: VCBS repeat-containing protein [Candidatus Hadarchaeum sp.]
MAGDEWERFLRDYYRVLKVPKKFVVPQPDGTYWPHLFIKSKMEKVGEDEEFVYLRNLPIEDPRSASHEAWVLHESRELTYLDRVEELKKHKVIDPTEVFAPMPFTRWLSFEEVSNGLPSDGQWQTALAVVDINKDGLLDIVTPPARQEPNGRGHIFLQGKGMTWKEANVRWPGDVPWDYGAVVCEDFDRDGILDLVFAFHFKSMWLLHGASSSDGVLTFDRAEKLPQAHGSVTSRALAVGDFDGDRRPDLAVLAELDLDLGSVTNIESGLVYVLLNKPAGWKVVDLGGKRIYGDFIRVADLDGDGWADVIAAKNTNADVPFAFLNRERGDKWEAVSPSGLPWMPYVFSVAASRNRRGPDWVALAMMQSVRWGGVQHQVNTVRLAKLGTGNTLVDTGELLRYDGAYLSAVAVGDLGGDGHQDVVVGAGDGTLTVFVNRGKGLWLQEMGSPKLPEARISYLEVKDLDGDGLNELIVMATTSGQPGFIKVFRVRPNRP